MRCFAVLAALAACGDNDSPPDSSLDAFVQCSAQFSGNFAESSSAAADCPTLAGTELGFSVPIAQLQTMLAVTIALPAAVTGELTSETVENWSALALQRIGDGGCVYRAGTTAIPEGSFTLRIDTAQPLHGSLAITASVLTLPSTECGGDDIENITLKF